MNRRDLLTKAAHLGLIPAMAMGGTTANLGIDAAGDLARRREASGFRQLVAELDYASLDLDSVMRRLEGMHGRARVAAIRAFEAEVMEPAFDRQLEAERALLAAIRGGRPPGAPPNGVRLDGRLFLAHGPGRTYADGLSLAEVRASDVRDFDERA